MLTLNEIKDISFKQAKKGYDPESVDVFIDDVVESYDMLIKKGTEQKSKIDALTEENNKLREAVAQLKGQLQNGAAAPVAVAAAPAAQEQVTSAKIEAAEKRMAQEIEYTQEDIKNALLSAQKLANATIREARMKAEALLEDANTKAENVVTAAQGEVNAQKAELERLKRAVSEFRASILDKYKEHLQLVNSIPTTGTYSPEKKTEPEYQRTAPIAVQQPVAPAPVVEKQEDVKPAEAPAEQESSYYDSLVGEKTSDTQTFKIRDDDDFKFGADYDITTEVDIDKVKNSKGKGSKRRR